MDHDPKGSILLGGTAQGKKNVTFGSPFHNRTRLFTLVRVLSCIEKKDLREERLLLPFLMPSIESIGVHPSTGKDKFLISKAAYHKHPTPYDLLGGHSPCDDLLQCVPPSGEARMQVKEGKRKSEFLYLMSIHPHFHSYRMSFAASSAGLVLQTDGDLRELADRSLSGDSPSSMSEPFRNKKWLGMGAPLTDRGLVTSVGSSSFCDSSMEAWTRSRSEQQGALNYYVLFFRSILNDS
ncbi:hypothetical protein L6452_22011 [Arctium lappa]|uniref:Uncharacterized protein n=1 Tax=Arctium lappa TaxID=4217 RepID=A0ACB9B2Y0_ARCLA|nr:hypothetical protein L6452_22011 [Arctium lappa]